MPYHFSSRSAYSDCDHISAFGKVWRINSILPARIARSPRLLGESLFIISIFISV